MIMKAEDLLNIRDLIDEMQPHFKYEENVILCTDRMVKYLEYIIFDRQGRLW